jgi:dihydrofolate synthase/folylpolyglutamate synthase
MLASILQEAGYKTGLYTSPHLKDFRERIRINGEMISENEVTAWVEKFRKGNKKWQIEPSFFELTVALAFDYFASQKVDVAVIEVGLGGRLDSTNIINPEVGIITNIGLDHTNLLGNTLSEIAGEKAGIIKKNIPVVVGETQAETKNIFVAKANLLNAELVFADKQFKVDFALKDLNGNQILHISKNGVSIFSNLKLDLLGVYQQKNILTVLTVVEILQQRSFEIGEKEIYRGLENVVKNTGLLGRWQIIGNNPLIVCDTGHNKDGMQILVQQIKNTAYKKLHVVLGVVGDKNPEPVLELLPKNAVYYFTKANIPRSLNENELQNKARSFELFGEVFSSVNAALKSARQHAGKSDMIFIGGSTFVVAEIL